MVYQHGREVQIEVTSRHQHVSDKTRAFAIERAERLIRFNHRISRIQIILDEEHGAFLAEIIVHVDSRGPIFVKETSGGYRSALDGLLVKMERQLKKDKERRRNHKHHADPGLDGHNRVSREEQTYEDIVRQQLTS